MVVSFAVVTTEYWGEQGSGAGCANVKPGVIQ